MNPKLLRPLRQLLLTLILFLALGAILLWSTWAGVALSDSGLENKGVKEVKVSNCDQQNGIGSVFFNFEKLIIFYVDFPSKGNEMFNDLPSLLKYKTFNDLLIDTIKKSFSQCLGAYGEEKPIIVIPPFSVRATGEKKLDLNAIHDPKNLTVLIRVNYEPHILRSPSNEEYGQVLFFLYRPEASEKLSRLPLANNSGMMTFFPSDGDQRLKEKFVRFFGEIRPIKSIGPGVRPPWAPK
jgi:hypothetical protein